jgi:hypothetical protein
MSLNLTEDIHVIKYVQDYNFNQTSAFWKSIHTASYFNKNEEARTEIMYGIHVNQPIKDRNHTGPFT